MMIADMSRVIYSIARCILFPESNIAIVFKNKKSTKDAYNYALKLINKSDEDIGIIDITNDSVKFSNGSILSFDFVNSKVETEYIRGHRAKLPFFYDNDFHIDNKILEEALSPYIKKEEK